MSEPTQWALELADGLIQMKGQYEHSKTTRIRYAQALDAARLAGALAMREKCAEEPADDVIDAMAEALMDAMDRQNSIKGMFRGNLPREQYRQTITEFVRATDAARRAAIRSTAPEGM